jgi:hypothetical protein
MKPVPGLITIQWPGAPPVDAANYTAVFLSLSTKAFAQKLLALFPAGSQLVDETALQGNFSLTLSPTAQAMGIAAWGIQGTDPAGIPFDALVGNMEWRMCHPLTAFGDPVGGVPSLEGASIGFFDEPQFGISWPIWKYTPPAPAPPTVEQLQAEIAQLQKVQTPGMPF